jgi:hypothetical protein
MCRLYHDCHIAEAMRPGEWNFKDWALGRGYQLSFMVAPPPLFV